MSIIKCENVTLSYNKNRIVENLTFDVKDGDYLCILGENGTGKSTLIKAILGFISPTFGKITFAKELKANEIGYLSQSSTIPDNFPASVYEIILSGCLNKKSFMPFYTKQDKSLATENMKLLEISDLKDKSYNELSGGQRQRVLLARALCATKKLLLLDEPVSGLDPVAVQELYETINKLNKEKQITVIMVSHDIDASLKYSNMVLNLAKDSYVFCNKEDYLKLTAGGVDNV
jgi:zinc transport system ATP-binding protein